MKGDLDTGVLKEYIDHKCPVETHSQPRSEMVCGIRKIKNELLIDDKKHEFLCDIPNTSNLGQNIQVNNLILAGFLSAVIFLHQPYSQC